MTRSQNCDRLEGKFRFFQCQNRLQLSRRVPSSSRQCTVAVKARVNLSTALLGRLKSTREHEFTRIDSKRGNAYRGRIGNHLERTRRNIEKKSKAARYDVCESGKVHFVHSLLPQLFPPPPRFDHPAPSRTPVCSELYSLVIVGSCAFAGTAHARDRTLDLPPAPSVPSSRSMTYGTTFNKIPVVFSTYQYPIRTAVRAGRLE